MESHRHCFLLCCLSRYSGSHFRKVPNLKNSVPLLLNDHKRRPRKLHAVYCSRFGVIQPNTPSEHLSAKCTVPLRNVTS